MELVRKNTTHNKIISRWLQAKTTAMEGI